MGVTWDIGALRKRLQSLPSKFFKENYGFLGPIWPIVVLDNHYPIRKFPPALVFYDLINSQQRLAIPLSLVNFSLGYLEESIIQHTAKSNSRKEDIDANLLNTQVQLGYHDDIYRLAHYFIGL